MRKLWYAGAAIAGGFILFGAAAPAQADLLPGTGTAAQQADDQLTDMLGQADGVTLENPLRYSSFNDSPLASQPMVDFKRGDNGTDLNQVVPGEAGGERRPALPPAAQVIGGALGPSDDDDDEPDAADRRSPVRFGQSPVQQLPIDNLFGGGLPLIGGLLANGSTPSAAQRPTVDQTEAFEGGMPLLGGLGGLPPVNALRPGGSVPDSPAGTPAGMPAGGMTVAPADQPAVQPPAVQKPAVQKPKPAATPDDPRLHEEPIDGEHDRSFSPDVRPIAGVDRQYR